MEGIKILLAEDQEEIALLLKKHLENEGYAVDTVSNGQEAIDLFYKNNYQLIILDIMMPNMDGIEACRRLRSKTNIPIIMLTGKDAEIDKVIGLKIGADDYITKPFGMKELLARIEAQLRRYLVLNNKINTSYNQVLCIQDLKIDLMSYTVYRGDELLYLTAKEFELLKFFASNPNQVFTKEQIFKHVWGDNYIEDDNTVMVHIRRLRKKIEKNPQKPCYIQTVWGIGYKFIG